MLPWYCVPQSMRVSVITGSAPVKWPKKSPKMHVHSAKIGWPVSGHFANCIFGQYFVYTCTLRVKTLTGELPAQSSRPRQTLPTMRREHACSTDLIRDASMAAWFESPFLNTCPVVAQFIGRVSLPNSVWRRASSVAQRRRHRVCS